MSEIYRVRPANDKTLEELTMPYLWFSRPTSFNDTEDANILSFIETNESISDALNRLFTDKIDIIKESQLMGICCFSNGLPTSVGMRFFPGSSKGIVIEYDKEILEKHFIRTLGLGNCFKKIIYTDQPTKFDTSSGYDILWEKNRKDKIYKSVRGITTDAKETDKLFVKIFTRLALKYRGQRESRIILAGRNIPDRTSDINGYQVDIPAESIKCIHVHEKSSSAFVQKLKALGFEISIMKK